MRDYVKSVEIFFGKLLCVGVDVNVAVQLLKSVLGCVSAVHSNVVRSQIELCTTLHVCQRSYEVIYSKFYYSESKQSMI